MFKKILFLVFLLFALSSCGNDDDVTESGFVDQEPVYDADINTENDEITETDNDTIKTDDDSIETDDDAIETDNDTVETDVDAIETDNDTIEIDDDTIETDADTIETDDDTIETDDDTIETDDDTVEIDDDAIETDEDTIPDSDTIEVPLAGFGVISGDCGVIDDELASGDSFYFHNAIDFMSDPYDATDYAFLTEGGQEVYDDGNLGGSSIYSEVFSFEVLHRCELAGLLKTETEINYDNTEGKKTDLLVSIDGYKVGVSVTRAVSYPFDTEYTVSDAETLLNEKLGDIILSTQNVATQDKWIKQILHIIAYSDTHAESLFTAYNALDESVKSDTIVIVTVSDGDDSFLY